MPRFDAMNSPTTAPIMAAGSVMRSAARMYGSELGNSTDRIVAQRAAPITRVTSSRPGGTCRMPSTVLMNTTKNTKYAASTILGVSPMPNQWMQTGPSATAGMEYAMRKYGSTIRYAVRRSASGQASRMPSAAPRRKPSPAEVSVNRAWNQKSADPPNHLSSRSPTASGELMKNGLISVPEARSQASR